jgi:hypothetical protein
MLPSKTGFESEHCILNDKSHSMEAVHMMTKMDGQE